MILTENALPIVGEHLSETPLELLRLKKIATLDYYDGPLTSLFEDPETHDLYIYKWCDVGENHHRWLIFRTTFGRFMRFKQLQQSFLDFIYDAPDQVYFLADLRVDDDDTVHFDFCYRTTADQLPDDYLPGAEADFSYLTLLEESEKRLNTFIIGYLEWLNEWAKGMFEQGKYQEVAPVFQELVGLGYSYGEFAEKNEEYITQLNEVGIILAHNGYYKDAVVIFEKVVFGRELILGISHDLYVASLNNLIVSLFRFEENSNEKIINNVNMILNVIQNWDEKDMNRNKDMYLSLIRNCGNMLAKISRFDEVLNIVKWLQTKESEIPDLDENFKLNTLHLLSLGLIGQGKFTEALLNHIPLHEKEREFYGENSFSYINSTALLAVIYDKLNDMINAEIYYNLALTKAEKILGVDHPLYKHIEADYSNFIYRIWSSFNQDIPTA